MSTSPATTVGDWCDRISKRSGSSEMRPADGVVAQLRTGAPARRIIVLAEDPIHPAVTGALTADATELVITARHAPMTRPNRVEAGKRIYCGARPLQKVNAGSVTLRERYVTQLVAAGRTNVEIGHRLGPSNTTVKSYRRNVIQKLHARKSGATGDRRPKARAPLNRPVFDQNRSQDPRPGIRLRGPLDGYGTSNVSKAQDSWTIHDPVA
jgi:DNA-binding CsgD family transcriptional regulator